VTATEPDDEEPDLGSLSSAVEKVERFTVELRRAMAAVDQVAARVDATIENIRRERAREKWRNIAVSVGCALVGCILGALAFGRWPLSMF
jgi:hypothetical protein